VSKMTTEQKAGQNRAATLPMQNRPAIQTDAFISGIRTSKIFQKTTAGKRAKATMEAAATAGAPKAKTRESAPETR
jgi:hypothetical protein